MTPYCVTVSNAYNFCAFNFRASLAVRKYINNENFTIYGVLALVTIFNVRRACTRGLCVCVFPPSASTIKHLYSILNIVKAFCEVYAIFD